MQKVLTFGEIMLRLSTPGFERFSQARKFDIQFGGGDRMEIYILESGAVAHASQVIYDRAHSLIDTSLVNEPGN